MFQEALTEFNQRVQEYLPTVLGPLLLALAGLVLALLLQILLTRLVAGIIRRLAANARYGASLTSPAMNSLPRLVGGIVFWVVLLAFSGGGAGPAGVAGCRRISGPANRVSTEGVHSGSDPVCRHCRGALRPPGRNLGAQLCQHRRSRTHRPSGAYAHRGGRRWHGRGPGWRRQHIPDVDHCRRSRNGPGRHGPGLRNRFRAGRRQHHCLLLCPADVSRWPRRPDWDARGAHYRNRGCHRRARHGGGTAADSLSPLH